MKSGNEKGFTLVELAIVLVIIGIILGAVIKGKDMIENARHKQFISKLRSWEIAMNLYYDKKGVYPGDSDRDGKINGDVKSDLQNAKFINPPYEHGDSGPVNTVTVGSYVFRIYAGTAGGTNALVICASDDCKGTFSDESWTNFLEAFDGSQDGTSDGENGRVICVEADPDTAADTSKWTVGYNSVTPKKCTTSAKAMIYYL